MIWARVTRHEKNWKIETFLTLKKHVILYGNHFRETYICSHAHVRNPVVQFPFSKFTSAELMNVGRKFCKHSSNQWYQNANFYLFMCKHDDCLIYFIYFPVLLFANRQITLAKINENRNRCFLHDLKWNITNDRDEKWRRTAQSWTI